MSPSAHAMASPLVYEINTRCWLRELALTSRRPVSLANVPDDEFVKWRLQGFTHVWLMGLWASGLRSRAVYLSHPHTPAHLGEILPDWMEADVIGSPYAIADYSVPGTLGGEAGLAVFRKRLHEVGLGLMLDFIPNHVGLDHPWLELDRHPEYFVRSDRNAPDTFSHHDTWFAHGKDPYFPAWSDTVQLDHRRADTRAAVIRQLHSVADRCDAVRCDMSMLLLAEVFTRNWAHFPCTGPLVFTEFWAEAIAAVRRPGFLFLAEAYWDLEARLQSLGFDYTYNKRVLDFLIERRPEALSAHLLEKDEAFLRRSAHFLENHDEPRIASRLSFEEHQAAACLMLMLPGLRLLHDGQLTGATVRVPVHLARRPQADPDLRIAMLYSGLLGVLQDTAVGHGEGRLVAATLAEPGDETHRNCIAVEWTGSRPAVDLIVVNLSAAASRCRVTPASPKLAGRKWAATEFRSSGLLNPQSASQPAPTLTLQLSPHEFRWMHCLPEE